MTSAMTGTPKPAFAGSQMAAAVAPFIYEHRAPAAAIVRKSALAAGSSAFLADSLRVTGCSVKCSGLAAGLQAGAGVKPAEHISARSRVAAVERSAMAAQFAGLRIEAQKIGASGSCSDAITVTRRDGTKLRTAMRPARARADYQGVLGDILLCLYPLVA